MIGNNFFHSHKFGRSVSAQLIGNGTVTGQTISEPWRDGNVIAFLLNTGAVTGSIVYTFEVQLRGTSTWKDIMDSGSTDLTVTGAADTPQLAEIKLRDIDSDTYDAIRCNAVGTNAADAAGVIHVVGDLKRRPSGSADALSGFAGPYKYEA